MTARHHSLTADPAARRRISTAASESAYDDPAPHGAREARGNTRGFDQTSRSPWYEMYRTFLLRAYTERSPRGPTSSIFFLMCRRRSLMHCRIASRRIFGVGKPLSPERGAKTSAATQACQSVI